MLCPPNSFDSFQVILEAFLFYMTFVHVYTKFAHIIRIYRDHHGHGHMVVGFITTYAISAYHNFAYHF